MLWHSWQSPLLSSFRMPMDIQNLLVNGKSTFWGTFFVWNRQNTFHESRKDRILNVITGITKISEIMQTFFNVKFGYCIFSYPAIKKAFSQYVSFLPDKATVVQQSGSSLISSVCYSLHSDLNASHTSYGEVFFGNTLSTCERDLVVTSWAIQVMFSSAFL